MRRGVVCQLAQDHCRGPHGLLSCGPQLPGKEIEGRLAEDTPGAEPRGGSLQRSKCSGGKVTVDGTDSDGKPVHNEWTGKYDGKDYPVTGSSTNDTLS